MTTGIGIDLFHWEPDFDSLRLNLAGHGAEWDVVEVPGDLLERGQRAGLLGEFNRPRSGGVAPGGASVGGAPIPAGYSVVCLAFRRDHWHHREEPRWRDFWDTNKNPGIRSINDNPRGNLEFALLADGVPLKSLYPLDVDRAFKSLTKLKSKIVFWSGDPTEPLNGLASGSVAMAVTPCGSHGDAHSSLTYSSKAMAVQLEWWAFAVASENEESAAKFSAFVQKASRLSAESRILYWGVDTATARGLGAGLRSLSGLGSPQVARVLTINDHWWSVNGPRVERRWKEWRNNR